VQLETMVALGRAAELRAPHAAGHARRVSLYAAVLARALDGTEEWIEGVQHAALLHDIGLIGVPSEILTHPGPLAPAQLEAVRAHVRIGAQILEGASSDLLRLGRDVVLTHHERWDGSGYPEGLRHEEIPLAGRLVGLLDSWDAMVTDRPYRRALEVERAEAQIRESAGSAFDPVVVEAFLECLPRIRGVMRSL